MDFNPCPYLHEAMIMRFCPGCGLSLFGSCPECHVAMRAGWTFCGHCGVRLAAAFVKVDHAA